MNTGEPILKQNKKDQKPRKVAMNTLGCKLNQYETDALAARFQDAGYEIVNFEDQADAYIINTCTVTNKADRKTRNIINRAIHLSEENPAMVVVTGCYADSHAKDLEKDGRTFVVNNDQKTSLFELVDAHLSGELFHPESLKGDRFAYSESRPIFHTRGTLKIQDGCDNYCTFCIIPFVRGRAVSRPLPDILQSARSMIDQGYHELVLTGVNMSRYRYGEFQFADVVEGILNLPGEFRLRISSIEPDELDDRFLHLIAHPRLAPHLHLCLQSGSEKILLQMRRQYTYSLYREMTDKIRRVRPGFNITTDLITGFPGETDEDFQNSLRSVSELLFGHVHIFKYSVREGTRAQRMSGHVSEKIKSERAAILHEEMERVKRQVRSALIGAVERVLVEEVKTGEDGRICCRGLGEHYIPVVFPALSDSPADSLSNQFFDVRITGIREGEDPDLTGTVESHQ
jgi:threonylcarbamoyladenosine tRNA methylthiotransferase MtaB